MERRMLTKEDIDKVRDIEGFPIGTDEDIIALSDAPYYTACPNPFIEEFIREHGTPYDEETDDYHREPFAADVSEGKSDAIYNAHAYHTKVPYKAIMRYILHYTEPNDLVYDGFCGTGMTGVAAQRCGSLDDIQKAIWDTQQKNVKWGTRFAILNDLSTAATFISKNYTTPIDVDAFAREAENILEKCMDECGWMWETTHKETGEKGIINYVAWSDVLICPKCGEEIVFGETAATKDGKIKDRFNCPNCGMELKKGDCEKKKTTMLEEGTLEPYMVAEQVPLVINYSVGKKRFEKNPDIKDLEILNKVEAIKIPYWYPTNLLPNGYNTAQPIRSHGYNKVNMFYTKRILYFISALYEHIINSDYRESLLIWFTSQLINISRLNRYRPTVSFPYNPLSGTLYISSLTCESSPFNAYKSKIKKFATALWDVKERNSIISTNSTTDLSGIPSNSIDYIFTDPPFGGNLNYSELSFIWECWLKIRTNNRDEAIMNPVQNKGLYEYQKLMTDCFCEYARVLKPNRWITIEFHNSKNSVWNAIQEGLQRAGLIIADIRTLDKQTGTFQQVTSSSAVKQDLIISAYKPKESFVKAFNSQAGTEESAWAFIRQHLANVPIVVDADNNGKIDIIAERQPFLLYDRMIAYHIMQGVSIPIDATDFYKGLDEHFLKRDNMYFLPDQVNEYDLARATADVEEVQLAYLVTDEKSAIQWLYNELKEPKTYQIIMPEFMRAMQALDQHEKMPELAEILEENFLKDDDGKWYIPDLTKSGDIAKLREKNLLKEFQDYLDSRGRLRVFRSEAVRTGFAKLWKDKDYKSIVSIAERLPEKIVQEDPNLLMYYDISLTRVE